MAKVVRIHRLGEPDVLQLEEVEIRAPRAGEVRLKVEAIGLNRSEAMFRRGAYPVPPQLPAGLADGPRVYVGEAGERADDLAYGGPPMQPGPRYNHVTAAAALPVLLALLPGAEPLRWSTPAPLGLPGGFGRTAVKSTWAAC